MADFHRVLFRLRRLDGGVDQYRWRIHAARFSINRSWSWRLDAMDDDLLDCLRDSYVFLGAGDSEQEH